MANSVGSVAKSSLRLCFTLVNVTTPRAPRTPLPTKLAVAEKHTAQPLPWEHYTYHRGTQSISRHAAIRITGNVAGRRVAHLFGSRPRIPLICGCPTPVARSWRRGGHNLHSGFAG